MNGELAIRLRGADAALVRHAAFGFEGWADLLHVGALVAFGLGTWRIAIHAMTRKLID